MIHIKFINYSLGCKEIPTQPQRAKNIKVPTPKYGGPEEIEAHERIFQFVQSSNVGIRKDDYPTAEVGIRPDAANF